MARDRSIPRILALPSLTETTETMTEPEITDAEYDSMKAKVVNG